MKKRSRCVACGKKLDRSVDFGELCIDCAGFKTRCALEQALQKTCV